MGNSVDIKKYEVCQRVVQRWTADYKPTYLGLAGGDEAGDGGGRGVRRVGLGLGAVLGEPGADLLEGDVLRGVHDLGACAGGGDEGAGVGSGHLHLAVLLGLHRGRGGCRRRAYRRVTAYNTHSHSLNITTVTR